MPDKPLPVCEFDSNELIVRLDLQFAADVKLLGPVVEQVLQLIQEMECAQEKQFEVELALHEALVNAIVHGCGNDPDKNVQLTVCCDISRGVLMVVRDPGSGFDVSQIPSPVIGDNVFSSRGRGIFLINQLMDEVQFHKQGTEIRMVKR